MIDFLINWLTANEEALRGWAVAGGTLILAIVAYLQVRASNRQIEESKFQRRIEKHNEDLKNLFQYWVEKFPQAPFTGLTIYEFFSNFEENPLFSDLENHLPEKYRNIMEKWELYKDLGQKYCDQQAEIIGKIKILISEKQKDELNYNSIPVYLKAIELITGKKQYYIKQEEIIHMEPRFYSLSYDRSSWFVKYPLIMDDPNLTEDQTANITSFHEEISNITKREYKNEIEKLVDIEYEMKQIFEELQYDLGNLTIYPEYNNMNCEYIIFNS